MSVGRSSQPLMNLIAAVRRRARNLLFLHALSWLAAAVLGGMLTLSLIDFLLRIDDLGVRWFFSLLLVALGAAALWRFLLPVFRRRLGDVELARRIESRFPALGEQLSSAVDFLQQADDLPHAGSALLRRAVVIEATDAITPIQVSDVVDARPIWRAAAPALAVVATAIIAGVVAGGNAHYALAHLLAPWQDDPWPRQHQLAPQNPPPRIARGQSFEARVIDRNGELPDEVRVHFRFANADGTASEEVERMQPLAGAMVARRDQITRSFAFRAEGGDDHSMPWTAVEVIDPPATQSLNITLHPPTYTGLPSESSGRKIVALAGTRVDVRGQSTKPLVRATLKQDGLPDVPCAISPDQRTFAISGDAWTLSRSGHYWFELRDVDDVTGGADDRWELQSLPDTAPIVTIEQPSGSLLMTPTAVVPLKIVVSDNLAIRSVDLLYVRSDQSDKGEMTVPLLTGPEQAVVRPAGLASVGDGERRAIEHRWSLAEFALQPGARISFHVTAGDYKPQSTSSDQRLITIISAEDLRQRLAGKQAFILGELRRILKLQTDTRSQVAVLSRQFRDAGRIRRQDVSQLQGAQINQRQVARSLASPGEGILLQIDAALEELRNNQVDSPNVERQFQTLRQEVKRLASDELPPIESLLTAAQKSAESVISAGADERTPPAAGNSTSAPDNPSSTANQDFGVPTDARAQQSLDAAGAGQQRVIAALEKLLEGYSQWINYREFAQDISQIRREQTELENQIRTLGATTLAKDFRELTSQQQSDLRQLAQRQTDLQRQFDKAQQQLDRAAKQIADSDPLAAQTLTDALHAAQQAGISGQMSAGSRQLQDNQIGQSLETQKSIDAALAEMLDILAGKREHELTHLASKLRAAEQQLQQLRGQQQALASRQSAAQQMTDAPQRRAELKRLSAAQQQLQQEVDRFARQLKRLQAARAAEKLAGAAEKTGAAGNADEKGEADAAAEQTELARQDLDDAQQQLAQRRKQAEDDLAGEQLAKIDDVLKGLLDRQQGVIDETLRLDQLRLTAGGQLNRAQSQTAQALARQQAAVAEDAKLLAEKIAAAEVFHLALEAAGEDMQRAVTLLFQRETGLPAQQAERAALARFTQIKQAIEKDQKPRSDDKPPDKQADGKPKEKPVDGIQNLAQLKLLKLMQQDLQTRTQAAEADGQPPAQRTESQLRRFAALRREQEQLADLLTKLTKRAREKPPEDEPDNLPDVRHNDDPPRKIKPDAQPADR